MHQEKKSPILHLSFDHPSLRIQFWPKNTYWKCTWGKEQTSMLLLRKPRIRNIDTQKKFQPNVEPVNQLLMRSTPYAYINVEHTASSLLLLIVSCKVCNENWVVSIWMTNPDWGATRILLFIIELTIIQLWLFCFSLLSSSLAELELI